MAEPMNEDKAKPNVTPELVQKHLNALRKQKVKCDEEVGIYRALRKAAKDSGMNLAAVALVERLAKMDPEEATLMLKQMGFYASCIDLTFAKQADMFAHYDNAQPTEKSLAEQAVLKAEDDGRYVGAGGDSETLNPHQAGSEHHVAWLRGWKNGRQFFDRRTEVAGTETKTPRGRKAKSGNPEDRMAA